MNDFKKTITLQTTEHKVYEALTNGITKWWTELFEGISNTQGETFTIRFGASIFKTFLVEELIAYKKVVWLVTDTLIDIPELNNKREWLNTKIVWEISSKDNQTIVTLTHFGLTPQVECYTICEDGWQNFTQSLVAFIETGKGNPFKMV